MHRDSTLHILVSQFKNTCGNLAGQPGYRRYEKNDHAGEARIVVRECEFCRRRLKPTLLKVKCTAELNRHWHATPA
jgi:hypothetical protein